MPLPSASLETTCSAKPQRLRTRSERRAFARRVEGGGGWAGVEARTGMMKDGRRVDVENVGKTGSRRTATRRRKGGGMVWRVRTVTSMSSSEVKSFPTAKKKKDEFLFFKQKTAYEIEV